MQDNEYSGGLPEASGQPEQTPHHPGATPDTPQNAVRTVSAGRRLLTSPVLTLIILYIVGCAVRILFLQYVSPNPYIAPDEPLYMNLARALGSGGGVSLRGQPVNFRAVLYPLIMSVLYRLPAGSDIFGAAQVMNTLIMSLAVFPAYALARRAGCQRGAALAVSVAALLMPDLFMATRFMTEALTYPLLLLSFVLCARFLERMSVGRMAAAVVCVFALYLSKEGGVGVLVALVAVLVWRALAEKSKDDALYAVGSAASFALLWVLWLLVLRLLGVDFSTPTIYETQTRFLSWMQLLKTGIGLSLYALFIPVGFGVFTLLLPLSQGARFKRQGRWLLRLVLITLFVYVAGICYVIYVDEIREGVYRTRVHLRYLFPFIPVLLGYLFSRPMRGARMNFPLAAGLSVFGALLFGYGLEAFGSRGNYCIDALLLSFLSYNTTVINAEYTLNVILVAFTGMGAWWIAKRGWDRRCVVVFCAVFGLQLVIANFTAYETNHYSMSDKLTQDAQQVSSMLAGKRALLLSEKENGTFDSQLIVLDGALTNTPTLALAHDFAAQSASFTESGMLELPGYWVAGTPAPAGPLEAVVINRYAQGTLRLADDVKITKTDNDYFIVASLPESGHLLHSALVGLHDSNNVNDKSAFWLFDSALTGRSYVRLRLIASATGDGGKLKMTYNGQYVSSDLSSSRTDVEMILRLPGDGQPVCVELRGEGGAQVHSYTIEGVNRDE